jgi:hypothetical protein
MSMNVSRTMLAAIALALAAFWAVWAQHQSLISNLAKARADAPTPPVMAGLQVRFDGSEPLDGSDLAMQGRRVLLFVVSDECAPCQRLKPRLRELILALPMKATDGIVILSYEGAATARELAGLARDRSLPAQARLITARDRFQLATGLYSTPMTVLLNEASEIVFASNTLDLTEELLIRDLLDRTTRKEGL